MSSTFKAVEYDAVIHHEAVTDKEPWNNVPAYAYKTRDRSQDKAKQQKYKHIKQWMKEHESFVRAMDEVAIEIAKGSWAPDDKFDAKQVKELLKQYGLEPDFTASELLRVWRKG